MERNPYQPPTSTLGHTEHCPHCQAPVVAWKRRWFRDDTYHCEACGGDSKPEFRWPRLSMFIALFATNMGNSELGRHGFSAVERMCITLPVVIGVLLAIQYYQPLRKIIPEKPAPLPAPNTCECPSSGITLKRGLTDCHWCGWKPDVQPLRES